MLATRFTRCPLCVALLIVANTACASLMAMPPQKVGAETDSSGAAPHVPSTYTLGPDDQLIFVGANAEEIVNKPFRIDSEGKISVPMLGRFTAAGLTIPQFEAELNRRLKTYIREPDIVVSIAEFRSQPVSVIGAVKLPGTHQLQGRKTLVEMIALAGGFREDAGNAIKISRALDWGKIPLPNAAVDPSGKYSVAEVRVKEMLEAVDPRNNILICPNDVISVPRAQLVYVIGDVKKAGGFILAEREEMSVLQALSLAEGVNFTADSKHARIFRTVPNAKQRQELPVDVKGILNGKTNDVALLADDILFVPSSTAKRVGSRSAEAIVQAATGVAIWH